MTMMLSFSLLLIAVTVVVVIWSTLSTIPFNHDPEASNAPNLTTRLKLQNVRLGRGHVERGCHHIHSFGRLPSLPR